MRNDYDGYSEYDAYDESDDYDEYEESEADTEDQEEDYEEAELDIEFDGDSVDDEKDMKEPDEDDEPDPEAEALADEAIQTIEVDIYQLMEDYRSGSDEKQKMAATIMFTQNAGFINYIINKRYRTFVNSEDDRNELFQCGCVGFMEALKKYDPKKGKLTTWLVRYMCHEMQAYINIYKRGMTVYYGDKLSKVTQVERELEAKGYEYTDVDVANATGLSLSKVRKARAIKNYSNTVHYENISYVDANIRETAVSPEREYEMKEEAEILVKALEGLTPEARMIVINHTEGSSFRDQSAVMNMSQDHIKRIYQEAMIRLRNNPNLRRYRRDYLAEEERVLNQYRLPFVPKDYASKAMDEVDDLPELPFD